MNKNKKNKKNWTKWQLCLSSIKWKTLFNLLILFSFLKIALTLSYLLYPEWEKSVTSSTLNQLPLNPAIATAQEKKAQPTPEKTSPQNFSEELSKLKAKEQELMQKEASLKELEKRIDSKLAELKKMEANINQMLEEANVLKNKKIKHLVDVYANMKPQQAAQVLETLDEDLAVKILAGMNGRKAGEILSYIKTKKAATLSEKLTKLQTPFGQ